MLFDYKKYLVIIIISIFPNTVFSDTVHDPTAPKIFGNVDSAGTFNRATAAVEEELTLQGIVNKKTPVWLLLVANCTASVKWLMGIKSAKLITITWF
ncbi:hypothetical protein [Psychrosphaera algicola]|uniref:Uncharacterized protein n=1 Tax=Psychrosphaera algicola TaxID=3023714 RepID=A0ABT5FDI2_9GAMM|nr:hypothetical protein [Psychrosphaera sp. G1-22]MDC2889590.1 hypothetical protein [Psychrosphaera sp. G1-22]